MKFMRSVSVASVTTLILSTSLSACATDSERQRIQLAQAAQPAARTPDVIFVPTPQAVVDEMLKVTNVKKGDVIYDLGSGDGRIVITAAKRFGTRGIGIDLDPQRIAEANENARKEGVSHGDVQKTDLLRPTSAKRPS
jgi:predicted RNA methylase